MPRPDPIVQADRVELVDDEFSTQKRQRVADYILDNWNDSDEITLTEIAEETATSRQHVKNTLEEHFRSADQGIERDGGGLSGELDERAIRLVLHAYRLGYRDGRRDARSGGPDDSIAQLLEHLRE